MAAYRRAVLPVQLELRDERIRNVADMIRSVMAKQPLVMKALEEVDREVAQGHGEGEAEGAGDRLPGVRSDLPARGEGVHGVPSRPGAGGEGLPGADDRVQREEDGGQDQGASSEDDHGEG